METHFSNQNNFDLIFNFVESGYGFIELLLNRLLNNVTWFRTCRNHDLDNVDLYPCRQSK